MMRRAFVGAAVVCVSVGILIGCKATYTDASDPGASDAGGSARGDDDDGGATLAAADGGGVPFGSDGGLGGGSDGGQTSDSQCQEPYVYCNDFEALDALHGVTELAGFDGNATLVGGVGPTGGRVAQLEVAAGEKIAAFSLPLNATSIRLDALIRLETPDTAEGAMLFALEAPGGQNGVEVFVHNALFTISPYTTGTPSLTISAGDTTNGWFHFDVETAPGEYSADFGPNDGDGGGASVELGGTVQAPLTVVFGIVLQTPATGTITVDVDLIKVTAL